MQGLSHIVDCYLDFCHSCFNPLLTLFTFIKTGHLHLVRKYARTLSVPRNEQFSERKAQGKLEATRKMM